MRNSLKQGKFSPYNSHSSECSLHFHCNQSVMHLLGKIKFRQIKTLTFKDGFTAMSTQV